jgi:hypothetical protein
MDTAMKTGDTSGLLQTTARSCACRSFIAYAQSIHKQGRVVGSDTTISHISYAGGSDPFSAVELEVDLSPFQVINPAGTVVVSGGHESATYIVEVAPLRGEWLVYSLNKVSR